MTSPLLANAPLRFSIDLLAVDDVNGPEGLTLTAHIFLIAGTLVSLGFILWLLRHRKLRGKYAMLWTALGFGLLVLAVFPQLLAAVSNRLGIYYAPALFLVVAIGFLLVIVIQFSWELSRMEDHTRTLAEEVALLRAELDLRDDRVSGSGRTAAVTDRSAADEE